ncbi:HAD-IB family hydrolase [Aestuariirhabdus sp. Z084]|uniref:histidinol-phosphatase n=1 Tax=Aestuariirhabdus haliotis TaxID=2918751 RepID=UPI00201B44D2|nr:HAD family hydrolase [Aestuariirhabdus haliotis]MCL6415128.1 HAD-IB family hydrolase [Aestuariirhabdus haliotis]MCL6419060.1 HAD-IB family hydrolase [Aestuariirhabdus haliotis]
MALAIFDLDNTLIGGDSDHAWGEFLVEQGVVDAQIYREANDRFYQHYQQGTLDIHEFLSFALRPLSQHSMTQLQQLHSDFMRTKIEPMMLPKAAALLAKHRQDGDFLLIITATNHFVTAPIGQRLGVDDLLATDPEIVDGRYTGEVSGTPCFQEGKVERLQQWLEHQNQSLAGSYFYSDSCNDLPLLELVDNPVAVDADARLSAIAVERNWPLISLRDDH